MAAVETMVTATIPDIRSAGPGAIGIRCSDDVVRSTLQSWVDALQLSPPVPLWLDIGIAEPGKAPAGHPIFRQPGIAFYSGLHMEWRSARASATLTPDSPVACVTLSHAALARLDECARVFLSAVVILLLRRSGWHHMHGAMAFDPRGFGWLIIGDSGAGKSTTTALLAAKGWRVGSDDIVFVGDGTGGRVTVMAARTPIALRARSQRLFDAAGWGTGGTGGTPLSRRRKVGYWPEELGSQWIDRIDPDIIAFVSPGQGHVTRATPIGPREAAASLVRSSAWVLLEPELAQSHLDLLGRLAAQARSFRVRLASDLFTSPARLQELIA